MNGVVVDYKDLPRETELSRLEFTCIAGEWWDSSSAIAFEFDTKSVRSTSEELYADGHSRSAIGHANG